MKLIEAVNILRQIVIECPELHGNNFLIMIPEPTEPIISKGYEIIIRTTKGIDDSTDQKLHIISLEHNLKILDAPNTMALYTPSEEL